MNVRIKISAILIVFGVLLAFMPNPNVKKFKLKPTELLAKSLSAEKYFTVDEVARFVNNEDSTVQLIDLRNVDEFRKSNIPGSVNIPFENLLSPDWNRYFSQNDTRKIFYETSDELANIAWVVSTGVGIKNCFVMKGGLNEWHETIMNSKFEGESITPRENALFENRYRAREIYNQFNSLPDSLKTKYFDAKRLQQKKLDGGCE